MLSVSTTAELIDAIVAANGSGAPIELTPGTTFDFTSPYADQYEHGLNALPVITGAVTIVGNGDTIERDGNSTAPFRLFAVSGGGSLTLQNVTLQGGFITSTLIDPTAEGGAIYNSGLLNLSAVSIERNQVVGIDGAASAGNMGGDGLNAYGGGLYVAAGSVNLSNDAFLQNFVYGGAGGNGGNSNKGGGLSGGNGGEGAGGGIYVVGGSVSLSAGTRVAGNLAQGGRGGNGGFATHGTGGLGGTGGEGCGGGLFAVGGSVSLSSAEIGSNVAQGGNGGAGGKGYVVYNPGSSAGSANGGDGGLGGGGSGGGLYVVGVSDLSLSGNLFSFNQAAGGTGGKGGANRSVAGTRNGDGGTAGYAQGGGLYLAVPGSVSVTNNQFNSNVALGGRGGDGGSGFGFSGNAGPGGSGAGGGLFVTTPGGAQSDVSLSNDILRDNRALGGDGGDAVYQGNYGKLKTGIGAGTEGRGGMGGGGLGGGLFATLLNSLSLSDDTVSGNAVVGGTGGQGGDGLRAVNVDTGIGLAGGSGGFGGSALGGGLYVAGVSNAASLSGDTVSDNSAVGGNGGTGGLGAGAKPPFTTLLHHDTGPGGAGGNGGNGGAAFGGGLFAETPGGLVLNDDLLNGNNAQGGNGAQGVVGGTGNAFAGAGGFGGSGGSGEGGGLFVNSPGSVVLLTSNLLDANTAQGGDGSRGGLGGDGQKNGGGGGTGGAGGDADGGALDLFAAGQVTLLANTLSGDSAQGGAGGFGAAGGAGGGFNLINPGLGGAAGPGGAGGQARGGGLSVQAANTANTLVDDTFSADSAIGAQGGRGGTGGFAETGGSGGYGGSGGSGQGGGVYMDAANSILGLTNDTLAGNSTQGGAGGHGGLGGTSTGRGQAGAGNHGGNGGGGLGGGLYVSNGTTNLASTLIAGNTVTAGAGGQAGSGNPNGMSGSPGAAFGPDVDATPNSSTYDLFGDGAGDGAFGAADIIGVSPGLGPLQNNGGPMVGAPGAQQVLPTMALQQGSLAIDHGDTSAPGLPATDERGYARIVGNGVDIGAYEFGGTATSGYISVHGSAVASTAAGYELTYTLTVTNNGSSPQSNVSLADPLPAGTVLVSWSVPDGWNSSAPPAGGSAGAVTAWIDSLSAGSSATFTLVVQVGGDAALHTFINNTVSVGPVPIPYPNDSFTFRTTVLNAPTIRVVDDAGTYSGDPFPAAATAVGIDGTTPVSGNFSYTYYAGGSASGTPSSAAPVNAGTYTVVAAFTSSDPDYADGVSQTTFTINPAHTAVNLLASANPAVFGQPVSYTVTVQNLDTSPVATGVVQFVVDGSDFGSPVALNNGQASVIDAFLAGTGHTVTAIYSNSDGNFTNSTVSLNQTVQIVALEADPLNPTLTDLFVGGTAATRQIDVELRRGEVSVDSGLRNPPTMVPLASLRALIIYGQADDQHIEVDDALTLPAFLFGGDGDHTSIQAGGGPTVEVGGAGADNQLHADSGPSVLIAGSGGGDLNGSADDILIGGTTAFDHNLAALETILAEWSRGDESFLQRVANLQGTPVTSGGEAVAPNGSYTGGYYLNSATVQDNGVRDTMNLSKDYGHDIRGANPFDRVPAALEVILAKWSRGDKSSRDWLFARLAGKDADKIVGSCNGDVVSGI